jgi:hypothetical protein
VRDLNLAEGCRLMPNAFAYIMLLFWPLVAIWLFKRMPRSEALIWTLVAGYLLLPSRVTINLPLLPPLSKTNSPVFAVLLMCIAGVGTAMVRQRRQSALRDRAGAASGASPVTIRSGWLPASTIGKVLVLAVVMGPFITALVNRDQIWFTYGGAVNGLKAYDAFAGVMNHAVLLLPMLLARKYLTTQQDHRTLLRILMLAGLAYSVPMLIEVRLSPQLHTWIYGFFPSSFLQSYRFGGFRPVVFLEHGLRVALFAAMVFLAAAAMWSTAPQQKRRGALFAALWLAMMLVMCRSVGAMALGALFAPMILILGRRTQMLAAAAIAMFVLFYPAIRGAGIATAPGIMTVVNTVIPRKAGSLELRLVNEDQLLQRASERSAFGWGGWGRSRVYDEDTGKDLSITDGAWVIIIGEYGWVGYVGTFGLLALPILLLFRLRGDPGLTLETSALSLILSLNLVDLLPNSGLTLLTWLLAGALLGRAEQIVDERSVRLKQHHETRRRASAARPPEFTPEPKTDGRPKDRPLRGPVRPISPAAVRDGIPPAKARVAPQHSSRYPSQTDAPTSRRPPSGQTRN